MDRKKHPSRASRSASAGAVLAIASLLFFAATWVSRAQTPGVAWAAPTQIVETSGELFLTTMVSDAQGHVHLVYVDQPAGMASAALYYTRWDGYDWIRPVDVLIDPEASDPSSPRAVIDATRTLHVFWGGGNRTLRHAFVPLSQAEFPRAWSAPVSIAQALPASHDAIVSADGVMLVAYTDGADGSVRLLTSVDLGQTWSEPATVAIPESGVAAGDVRMASGADGTLHVVWTEYTLPDGWPPSGAFYSRSIDGGRTWTRKLQVAPAGHGQIGIATGAGDAVHLVWRSTIGGDGTLHQVSSDGGLTWDIPDRSDDRGGFSGLPSFARSSDDALHLVVGRGFYANWADGKISGYQDVITPAVRALAKLSDGEQALLVSTSGNRLHVVFELEFQSIWYTSLDLNLPPLPTVTPLARESSAAGLSERDTGLVQITPTTVALREADQTSGGAPATGRPSGLPLLAGLVPVLVIIGLAVALTARHNGPW